MRLLKKIILGLTTIFLTVNSAPAQRIEIPDEDIDLIAPWPKDEIRTPRTRNGHNVAEGCWGAVDLRKGASIGLWNIYAAHSGVADFDTSICEDGKTKFYFVKVTNNFLGIQSYYRHIRFIPSFNFIDNRIVNAGDVIGIVRGKDNEDTEDMDCHESPPHLHFEVRVKNEAGEWGPRIDNRYIKLDGQPIFDQNTECLPRQEGKTNNVQGDNLTSHHTGLLKLKDDATDGKMTGQTAVSYIGKIKRLLTGDRMVTAVQSGNKLRLRLWDIIANKIKSKGLNETTASTSDISMAVSGPQLVKSGSHSLIVVATIEDGKYKLRTYTAKGTNGSITFKDEITGEDATNVEIVKVSGTYSPVSRFALAIRTKSGILKLMTWDVNYSDGLLNKKYKDHANDSEINDLAITYSPTHGLIFTAVRQTDGILKLISWDTDSDGKLIKKGVMKGNQGKKIAVSQVLQMAGSTNCIITAESTNDDHLRLTSWKWISDGNFEPVRVITSGKVSDVAIDNSHLNMIVTAVRFDESGKIRDNLGAIVWGVSPLGNEIRRRGDLIAEDASNISVVSLGVDANFVTTCKDKNGNLKLSYW